MVKKGDPSMTLQRHSNGKKGKSTSVMLTHELMAAIRDAAFFKGETLAAWVRAALEAKLKESVERSAPKRRKSA